ncbi:hypothetical protein CRENBAI_010779 [Crenichthys baileyi]|uniref:GON-4-like protein n=1 Tax=Crenichthys baileyi TaxID=28760 RepID=A0AAV9RK39_9TELE
MVLCGSLEELQQFASRREELRLPSSFTACNLQGALDLLKEVEQREQAPPARPGPGPGPGSGASKGLLPTITPTTSSHAFPLLPADTAWLFATQPVFLYPELLPVCSLDPTLHSKHQRRLYTGGEDGLIVLGLKHFEGADQTDQLISSYLLCKSRWNIRKRIREMSGPRAPRGSVIKLFMTHGVVPPLPVACSRVHPEDQRPPVDRNTSNMPKWLKNSQPIIHKNRLDGTHYPQSLPPGCTLRLHPSYVNKSQVPRQVQKRLFILAHNASLLPLAKAPTDQPVEQQVEQKPISRLSPPPPGAELRTDSAAVSGPLPLALSPFCGTVPLTAVHPRPSTPICHDVPGFGFPVGQNMQQKSAPFLLPLNSLSCSSSTTPPMSCSASSREPGHFLLHMVWTPPVSCSTTFSHHAIGPESLRPVEQEHPKSTISPYPPCEGEVKDSSPSTLSPFSSSVGDKEEEQEEDWSVMGVSLKGGERGNVERGEQEKTKDGGDQEKEETDGDGEEEEQGGEEDDGGREERGGEREDGDKDRRGDEEEDEEDEEEEEEDFDDLTQDEDEEEVMSSASEESVLSVPELQETMKQLTWLAAERRLCNGDSEDDHSPTSQEDEDEEDDETKGEEPEEGRSFKSSLDKEMPSGEKTAKGRRCSGRGRGRTPPLRGLARTRQERLSKDTSKLSLLYDENLLEKDPLRESKDAAFAQSYLNRVREALEGAPEQVQEFVSLLSKFEQVGEGQEVTQLFRKLHCILGDHTDLLRDFAAFLLPEQALLCGLFEEQQAFERSRRFLRRLEISFGDNPSHYQKIIKALQTGPDLSPSNIQELKAQMATLLKGHTHLQAEFWVFFDDLRPPLARPEQFEDAYLPEEAEGGEGGGQVSGDGASGSFEEVTLPDLEEEEDGHKIRPITSRRQRRKMESHRSYKFQDCEYVFHPAKKPSISHEGQRIFFTQDVSAENMKTQSPFNAVKKKYIEAGTFLGFQLHPCKMRVLHNGKIILFSTPKEAEAEE